LRAGVGFSAEGIAFITCRCGTGTSARSSVAEGSLLQAPSALI
jgi:hypothetical protein